MTKFCLIRSGGDWRRFADANADLSLEGSCSCALTAESIQLYKPDVMTRFNSAQQSRRVRALSGRLTPNAWTSLHFIHETASVCPGVTSAEMENNIRELTVEGIWCILCYFMFHFHSDCRQDQHTCSSSRDSAACSQNSGLKHGDSKNLKVKLSENKLLIIFYSFFLHFDDFTVFLSCWSWR